MTFKNAISWVEIPTIDLDRATSFYETIFDIKLTVFDTPQIKMRMFPLEDRMGIGAALTYAPGFYTPSPTDGLLVYLNGNPDVQNILDKILDAGGTISVPKTMISPDHGHMAVFIDTEGNRIALHAVPPAIEPPM